MKKWMRRWRDRLGNHGDFWLRTLSLGVRICPWYLEPVVVFMFSGVFYAACRKPVRAVSSNLRVLFPEEGFWRIQRRAFRLVREFAWTLTDAAHVRAGDEVIDWEICGVRNVDALAESANGALILTAHMGSYDLAGSLFADRLKRPLHIVRAPERVAESQDYVEASFREEQTDGQFVVHYNRPGNMLAVELTRLLQDDCAVAIQGDRILFDVAPHRMVFSETHEWDLPKGPFLLGAISRCPVYPLFITRQAWRRYRVTVGEPFEWPESRFDKREGMDRLAGWWSAHLRAMIEESPCQWFVFEEAFRRRKETEEGAK